MSKPKLYTLLSVAALSLGITMTASATTVSVTSGPFVDIGTFNSGTMPSGWTASGPYAGVVSGSVYNVNLAPTGDTTPYAWVGPQSVITAAYSAPISYFGLYWGSEDSYNAIAFTDTNGVTTKYGFNGISIPGLTYDGMTSNYVSFTDTGAAWKTVTFTSGALAFEFDDVTTTAATPEPASIALLAGGLLAIGAGAVRRRKSNK